jgi:hypothetical protein
MTECNDMLTSDQLRENGAVALKMGPADSLWNVGLQRHFHIATATDQDDFNEISQRLLKSLLSKNISTGYPITHLKKG